MALGYSALTTLQTPGGGDSELEPSGNSTNPRRKDGWKKVPENIPWNSSTMNVFKAFLNFKERDLGDHTFKPGFSPLRHKPTECL
jgi:hypothetical protein